METSAVLWLLIGAVMLASAAGFVVHMRRHNPERDVTHAGEPRRQVADRPAGPDAEAMHVRDRGVVVPDADERPRDRG